jgi:hypothetical protein
MSEQKTLFEQFYNASDELKAKIKTPFVRRKLKLRFQSAFASITEKQANLEVEVNSLSEKVENLDINRLLEISDELETLDKDKKNLAEMYKAWFGKELKDIDEE